MLENGAITLVVKGDRVAALQAADAHGIWATYLKQTLHGETVLECAQCYEPLVRAWMHEPARSHEGGTGFAPGTLLLFALEPEVLEGMI